MSELGIPIRVECPDFIKLSEVFRSMAYEDQRKIIMPAFRKALDPTINTAKYNVIHSKTGNLRESIGMLTMSDELAVVIGTRKRRGYRGFHGHLVEEGTQQRQYIAKKSWKVNKGGRWYSFVPGDIVKTGRMNSGANYAHFLRKAIKATGNEALNIMASDWDAHVIKWHEKHNLK